MSAPQVGASGTVRRRIVVVLVLGALVAAGVFWWQRPAADRAAPAPAPAGAPARTGGASPPGPSAARAVPVVVQAAVLGTVGIFQSGLGTVTPLQTVSVRPRVDGLLARVLFREGDTVRAGQVLAEIDPRPFQVQVTQAEGQLARDQALLANARVDLERYTALFEQDSIARQQLDTQAALVRQYEAGVMADRGALDSARLQLSFTRVVAPIAGRLGLRQVDPGNIVRASDANGIVVITQLAPIGVVFSIPEQNLPPVLRRLRANEAVPVIALDRDQRRTLAQGTLLTVDNQIDTATGTVRVKAQFPNDDLELFPNQFVNARMQVATLRDAVLVPVAAVQRGAPGTFVYVVSDDGVASVRVVRTGAENEGRVAIVEGLKAGERVVVDGTDRLRDGTRVDPVDGARARTGDAPPARGPRAGAGPGAGDPARNEAAGRGPGPR